jgi:hypothetical protein
MSPTTPETSKAAGDLSFSAAKLGPSSTELRTAPSAITGSLDSPPCILPFPPTWIVAA